MRTLSSTELRATLSAVMDQVNDDHQPLILTRAKGRPVVLVSLEDWASMDETSYLLSSPLKGDLAGFWSRRIDREHRLVYRVSKEAIEIAQYRYHY